jgi:diguanylate cyclase (GGDEF)-like protein
MTGLSILIFLLFISYTATAKYLNKYLAKKLSVIEHSKKDINSLSLANSALKERNVELAKEAQETTALYDITRDICKSLNEEKIFKIFKEEMGKYIEAGECVFLKEGVNLPDYKDYTVLPLNIEKHTVGYLAARGISAKDEEKFHILAHQFLVGIKRAVLYKKFQELTITDTLTQVFNRRYFSVRLNEEFARSRKFSYPLSFLMVDIDLFKECNDRYGHLVGDAVLKDVTRIIKENIRQIDFMGRYGGEELSVALVETDKEPAFIAAERIRQAVASAKIRVYDEELRITISIGLSTFPQDCDDSKGLIEKADAGLYKAKQSGRNKTCVDLG